MKDFDLRIGSIEETNSRDRSRFGTYSGALYKKVYEMIRATGKNHVIMYHDGMWKYPLIRQKFAKDIIIMIWDYTAKTKFPLAQKVIEAGFPIILSSQNLGITRHFPDYLYSSKNIINITESAKKLAKTSDKVVGVLNSTWGNQYYSNFRENDLYGIILASNAASTEKPLTLQKILPEMASCLFGLKTPQDISMFVELFEDLSHMVLNYSLPIRRFQQPFFTFLYRHPFYTTYPPAWIQNPKSLLSNANAVLEKLQTIDENVTAGQDLIPFLHFSAEIGQLLGEKRSDGCIGNISLKHLHPTPAYRDPIQSQRGKLWIFFSILKPIQNNYCMIMNHYGCSGLNHRILKLPANDFVN